ncbi:MAG: hypothetical protein QXW65_02305 [Candidatus Pacearchaeota archaeon]
MNEYNNLSEAVLKYFELQEKTSTILDEYLEKTGLDKFLKKDSQ